LISTFLIQIKGFKGFEYASAEDAPEEMVPKLGEAAGKDRDWAIEWFMGVTREMSSSREKGIVAERYGVR